MSGKYDDIIDLTHPTSARHPRMRMEDRAAQFSPFAALTGYEAAIEESARLTQRSVELEEDARAQLDLQLRYLHGHLEQKPRVQITHFVHDERKEGGKYVTVEGAVCRVDPLRQCVLLAEGEEIEMRHILQLQIL